MVVEPGEARRVAIAGLTVTRERHEPDRAAALVRAQASRHLVAVHLRQPDIDERDLGLKPLRLLERRGGTIRRGYVVPFELEQHRERISRIRAVVDDEHTPGADRSR